MHRARPAALIALAVLAAPACARTTTGIGAPIAHADPTTTPSSPKVFPPEKIDTLLLSQDEVNGIVTVPYMRVTSQLPIQKTPALADGMNDTQVRPDNCSEVVRGGLTFLFGGNRAAAYRAQPFLATGNDILTETVGVFASDSEARESFTALINSVKQCSGVQSIPTENAKIAVSQASDESVAWQIVANTSNAPAHSPAFYVVISGNTIAEASLSDAVEADEQLGKIARKILSKAS